MVDLSKTKNDPLQQIWDLMDGVHAGILGVQDSGQHMQPMAPFVEKESNSIWFYTKDDSDRGGYHLVWTRDMVQTATALLARTGIRPRSANIPFSRDMALVIRRPLVTARGIGETTLVHSRVWKEREQVESFGQDGGRVHDGMVDAT